MENFTIKAVTNDKGNYIILVIVKRYQEDETSMYWDEDLIVFGKYFTNHEQVGAFMETQFFQDTLRICRANQSHF